MMFISTCITKWKSLYVAIAVFQYSMIAFIRFNCCGANS